MQKIFSGLFIFFLFSSLIFAQKKQFTLLHTSDEHSTLMPIPYTDYSSESSNSAVGGFARLATKVKALRAEKESQNIPTLLFSSGDIFGGSPFSWLIPNKNSYEISIMQQIGYDGMTLGNHCFDYGLDVLAEYLARAGYLEGNPKMSVINSHFNIPDHRPLKDIHILPYKIYTLSNDLKIGVLGILGAAAMALAPGAEDVTIFDQIEAGNNTVQALKEEGADIIILLSHSGLDSDKEMAKKIKGLDIILGGHDHIQTPEPIYIGQTLIFHPDHYLKYLGQLDFEFDAETGKFELTNQNYFHALTSDIPEDSVIAQIIHTAKQELDSILYRSSKQQFGDVGQSIIQSDFDLIKDADYKETTIGNFITDAMRLEALKVTGARVDVAIQGNGVIRGDILTGTESWSKGNFALFDMLTMLGLGKGPDKSAAYPMVSCYLTEKEIFNAMEATTMLYQMYGDMFFLQVSGIRYTYDPGKSIWMKIPFTNTPIPATKAIKSIHLYTGEGIQDDSGNYIELDRNGDRLFHVVTDYYVASFLPLVGEVLPKLGIAFKDKDGNEKSLDEIVIKNEDGSEFKGWQALALYAHELEKMPDIYQETQNRITKEEGIPLKVWSYTILCILLAGIVWGIEKKKVIIFPSQKLPSI